MQEKARIGVVWPNTGEPLALFEMATAERLNAAVGNSDLEFDVGYSHGPEGHSIDALHSVGEAGSIAAAGAYLAQADAQAVIWACTSGSFIGGFDWSLKQREELRSRIGRPVTSGTLALISASLRLGFETVDVLSPYPDDVSRIFSNCLEDAGLTVLSMQELHSPGALASANLSLADGCRAFATDFDLKGDAILIPDTAANSLENIPELEAAAGRPVLTVNQACVFEGAALIERTAQLVEKPAFQRFKGCREGRIL